MGHSGVATHPEASIRVLVKDSRDTVLRRGWPASPVRARVHPRTDGGMRRGRECVGTDTGLGWGSVPAKPAASRPVTVGVHWQLLVARHNPISQSTLPWRPWPPVPRPGEPRPFGHPFRALPFCGGPVIHGARDHDGAQSLCFWVGLLLLLIWTFFSGDGSLLLKSFGVRLTF